MTTSRFINIKQPIVGVNTPPHRRVFNDINSPQFKTTPLVIMISLALMSSASYAATPKSLPSNGETLADTQYSASGTLNGTYTFSAPEVEIESNFSLSNDSAMSSTGTIIFTPGAPDRMQAQAYGSGTQATISAGNIKIKTLPDGQDPNKMWGNGLAASSGATLTVNVTDTLSGDTNGRSVKATGKGSHLIISSKTVHLKNSLIPSNGFSPKPRVADFFASGETIAEMKAIEDITLEGGTDVSSSGVMNIMAGGNITIGNSVYNVGETNIKAADNASSDSVWTFNNIIANRLTDTTGKGVTIESKGKEISITNGISVGTGSEHNSNNMLTIKNPNAELFIYGRAHSYKQQKGANGKYVDVLITNDYGLVSQSWSSAELDVKSITINEGLYAFNGHDKVHLKASEDITLKKTSAAPTLKVKDEKTEVTLEGKKITLTGKEGFNTVEILDSGSSTMIASEKIAIADDTLVKNNAILNITSPVTVIEGGALSVIDNAKVNFTNAAGSTPKLRVTNPRSAEGKTGSDEDPLEALYVNKSQLDFTGVDTTLVVSEDPTYLPSMSPALRLENEATLTLDEAPLTVVGDMVMNASSALTIGEKTKVRQVGDILLANEAKADITLNAESTWEGRADDWLDVGSPSSLPHSETLKTVAGEALEVEKPGTLSLTMAGGTWTARGQSTLSALTFDKGVVDMTKDVASSVSVGKLSGTGGTVKMALHSDPTKSDMLYVKDASEASPVKVDVALADGADVTAMKGLRFASTAGYTGDDLFEVTSKDQGFNDMAYTLAHEAYDQANSENANYNAGDGKPGTEWADSVFGDAGTNWYLDKVIVTPSKPAKVIMATARRNYWQAVDMDRLNKRLGDRRLAGDEDHGLWVRMRHDRLGTNAGVGDFRSRDWTYQVGYDYSWLRDNGKQLFGLALDYKDGDTHYRNITGSGSSDRVGLTAYTTWLGNTGWYYDAVARWGRLSNDFTLFNSRGERITADYHNSVWSLSLEGGKKLTHEASRLYFEPQAQIQLLTVSGADYTTSQETKVHQDRLNSVITRLGFRLGRDFGAQERSTVYVKADWMREWRGRETIRAFDITTPENGSEVTFKNRGNWFDVGLGVQSPFTENLYGFLDAEYRFGNDLQKSWQFNTGVRWLF